MKIFCAAILIFLFLFPAASFADFYADVKEVKEYNPDGQKYEFTKDYLISLGYLELNVKRAEEFTEWDSGKASDAQKAKTLMDALIRDNANLRVAKNTLKRYAASENGLILKVTKMFMEICDEQVALNTQERELYQSLYDAQAKDQLKSFDKKTLRDRRAKLAQERRSSFAKIFESSMIVEKILVSSQTDRFGEFVQLGITREQRQKLLSRIKELFPSLTNEKPQSGQSFIDASVSAVKARLLDTSWSNLPG
jgi:hypothetical protein